MRRYIILIIVLASCILTDAVGQSLCVDYPSVRYVHNGKNTGDMTFANGTTLTIEGKAHNIADISSISFSTSTMADSTVTVAYNGTSAQVTVAGCIAQYLTVTVSGAHVKIIQDEALQSTVNYTLSGTSDNGSLYMDGDFKAKFTLDNLTLNNPDSAAINIQDGKKLYITLVGTSTLTDNTGGSHNACMYLDGHPEFLGTGTLNVTGNTKHAITADEHLIMTAGTVNVLSAVGDGLHVSEYFQMDGGTLNINASGDGVDVSFKGVNKGTKDQYAMNGMVFINGGTLNITTTGLATKGLKCDSTATVAGGTTVILVSGNAYYDTTEADTSTPSALKCGGTFTMTAGTLTLTATGEAGRGINADNNVTFAGGTAVITTTGDEFVYYSGGVSTDSKSHAVKSDAGIYVTGGNVYVFASSEDGVALKQVKNGEAKITGGTVMLAGGKTSDITYTQNYKKATKQKLVGGQTYTLESVSYTIPAVYTNSSAIVQVSWP